MMLSYPTLAVLAVAVLTGAPLFAQSTRTPYAVAVPAISYLDTLAGKQLIQPCSRDAPVAVTGLWQVSPAEVRGLDTLLATEVGRQLALIVDPKSPMGPRLLRDTTKYFVQVIGIQRGTARRIYVSGFAEDTLQNFGGALRWRSRAVIVCDGGFGFFGVEFDPTSRTLARFFFNGVA